MTLSSVWENAWYGKARWVYLLAPLAWLFRSLARRRRARLKRESVAFDVPVVVVGNISVGGTGKTPLLIALVQRLRETGYRPGVVSRGYGGKAPSYPLMVSADTPVTHCGDEPLAIARATQCAVCVSPDRVEAAQALRERGCDIVLSDDGLQHYRLARDLEIAVVDGARAFGNGWCLPVGPLREPVERLNEVDWVVVNGSEDKVRQQAPTLRTVQYTMKVTPDAWHRVSDGTRASLTHFAPQTSVHAVAGIGNPDRFFSTLKELGLEPVHHRFADHHHYRPGELVFQPAFPVVMTAKDAVKCQPFAQPDWWYLSVSATLPEAFWSEFLNRIESLKSTPETNSIP